MEVVDGRRARKSQEGLVACRKMQKEEHFQSARWRHR